MAAKKESAKKDKCSVCKKSKKDLHVTSKGYVCDECYKAQKADEDKGKVVGKISMSVRPSRVLEMRRADGKEYTFFTDLTDEEIFAIPWHKDDQIISEKSNSNKNKKDETPGVAESEDEDI